MIVKRGDLRNNILTTLIAIVGMAILIVGIVKLYSLYSEQDAKNAEGDLSIISSKIGVLQVGQTARFAVRGVADGWYLIGWGSGPNRGKASQKCFFDSCVCVCYYGDKSVDYDINCDKKGYCERLGEEGTLKVITRYSPPDEIYNGEPAFIPLTGTNFIELEIHKTQSGIEVVYNTDKPTFDKLSKTLT
jgi:hypothetical protein